MSGYKQDGSHTSCLESIEEDIRIGLDRALAENTRLRTENAALREAIAEILRTDSPKLYSATKHYDAREAAARLIGWDAKEEKR